MAKKKKEVEEESSTGEEVEEAAPLGLPPLEDTGKSKKKKGKAKDEKEVAPAKSEIPVEVSIELEKVKAQIDALNQMRGMFSERFSTISEQIGELRTLIVNQEQEFSDLEVKSAKANEIMTQIEPEKFLGEINKLDMQIEAIKGKIESNESVNSMIMKELKEQRSRMALFKGIEDTIKLNQEVREELMTIKKVESNVEVHSNKVESMFIQIQKRFSEFETFKEMAEELSSSFKEQVKEFDTIKVKFAEIITKEDLDKSRSDLSNIMDNFAKRLVSIEQIADNMDKLVTHKKFEDYREKNEDVLKEQQKALLGLHELRGKIDSIVEEKGELPDLKKLKQVFAEAEALEGIKVEFDKLKDLMTYGFKRVKQMESKMFVEKETYETIRQIIKKYLDKGYTKSQITEAFEMQGWPKPLIQKYVEA